MKTLRMTIFVLILALSFALTGCDKNNGMIAEVTSEPTVPAATVAAPEITVRPVSTNAPDASGILTTEPPASAPEATAAAE